MERAQVAQYLNRLVYVKFVRQLDFIPIKVGGQVTKSTVHL